MDDAARRVRPGGTGEAAANGARARVASATSALAPSGVDDLHSDTVQRTPRAERVSQPGAGRQRARPVHRPAAEQRLIAIATAVNAALAASALRADRRKRTVAP